MFRKLIILCFCLVVSGCAITTMTGTTINEQGVREVKTYTKYYNFTDWVVEGEVGIEVWVDHDKKVSPFYSLQRSMGLLGPSDLQAKGLVTGYIVNLDQSAKKISDLKVINVKSSQTLQVKSDIELDARSVTRVLPGNFDIPNYGTSIDLRIEFLMDGIPQVMLLSLKRLTEQEMHGVRAAMPWFKEPYFPFDPPLTQKN